MSERTGDPRQRSRTGRIALFVSVILVLLACAVGATMGAPGTDWAGYLFNGEHSSTSPAATLTPAQAQTLRRQWRFTADDANRRGQPPAKFFASPTVFGDSVFIGSNTGWFYALNSETGAVRWKRMLGYQPRLTCPAHGFVSTAAVGPDPESGRATVYVGAGDGYLYALDAATGKTDWRSVVGRRLPSTKVNDIYNWASPVVGNGHVYMGVSSNCDKPWVRGGVQSFDQATGTRDATYWGVPPHATGGGVWTSPARDSVTGDVYVTIGSGPEDPAPQGDNYSIVRLDGSTLAKESLWTVPPEDRLGDPDFASSPTLFHAPISGTDTDLVAACNKNGVLYAWKRDDLAAGPVWNLQVGRGAGRGQRSCLAAPVWNGSSLIVGGNPTLPTMLHGVAYRGSLRKVSPSTGAAIWETGIGGVVLGTPSLSAGGAIAAPEYKSDPGATKGVPLVDADTGDVVNFLAGLSGFAQPVLVGGGLLVATDAGTLSYYAPPTTGDIDPPEAPDVQGTRTGNGTGANLTWPATDESDGPAAYRIFRNGALVETLEGDATEYADSGLSADQAYSYFVQVLDTAGNSSKQSDLVVLPGS